MEPQPQPVPQPVPQPRQGQGFWQRYRTASLAARIGIAAGVILLSCTLCTCAGTGALIGIGNALPPLPPTPVSAYATATLTPAVSALATPTATLVVSALATATPTNIPYPTGTTAPTATPKPLPTSPPVVSPNAATVGGSVAGFNNAIGSGNLSSDGPGNWFYAGPYGDTITWVYTEEDGYQWDPTSPHRVFEVTTQLEFTDYTLAQANAVTPHFLPPDATLLGTKSPPAGRTGIEKTYFSQMLANTLPAADFKDQKGNAVRPGTIFVLFDMLGDSVSEVELGTDEGYIYF